MSTNDDVSFLHCDNPDGLSSKDREKYLCYWASRTPQERLRESWRITCLKYGISPDTRMDKTRFEVIDLSKYEK